MTSSPQNERIRVLVTGVGGRSVGHQILHALQIKKDAYDLTAVDSDGFAFGLYQVAKRFVVPSADSPGYADSIKKLVCLGSIQVLIPGTEAEVAVLSEHREEIESKGCLILINPHPVIEICANKLKLASWLVSNGFVTPKTASISDWKALADSHGYPLVGKPAVNSGGSRNVALLANEQEVLRYIDETTGHEVLIQEYVDAPEEEYTVGVCISHDGKVIDSIVLQRKLIGLSLGQQRLIGGRLCKLSTGYSQGFIIKHANLQSACETLVMKLGMRGPANIQCRLVNGMVSIFEVHARFSGTTSIRADVGFNEVDLLIRSFLFHEKLGRVQYRTDVAAIRAFQSCVVPLAELAAIPRV